MQETGFYDFDARFYMPDILIFGTHDPLSEKTMQPYAYAYNNPIFFNDPTGMEGESASSDSGGGGGETGGEPTSGGVPGDTGVDRNGNQTVNIGFGVYVSAASPASISVSGGSEDGGESGNGNESSTYSSLNSNSDISDASNNENVELKDEGVDKIKSNSEANCSACIKGLQLLIKVLIKAAKQSPKAAKAGAKQTVKQFSKNSIDDAVKAVMKDQNKVDHLFNPKHNLGKVVSKLGGQENTIRAVLNAANGKLPANGVFNNVPVKVGGQTILIRGNVINNIPRLGTMFIP